MRPHPPEPGSDERLATAAGQGDRSAFAVLVTRWSPRLLGYLKTYAIRGPDAEDVVQEVWLNTWKSLPRWKADNFGAWLLRITRNAALDAKKHRKRMRPTVSLEDASIIPATAHHSPDREAVVADTARKLRDCLKHLGDEFRVVFEGYTGGEKYEDLAARLSIPLNTVKTRLLRAREKLRGCLGTDAS